MVQVIDSRKVEKVISGPNKKPPEDPNEFDGEDGMTYEPRKEESKQ